MGQQARASVGDGHEGLGRSHGGELLRLAGLLAGALLQHFDHGILLDDLSVQGLNPLGEDKEQFKCLPSPWTEASVSPWLLLGLP